MSQYIDYSKHFTFDEFKKELIKERFLKRSNNLQSNNLFFEYTNENKLNYKWLYEYAMETISNVNNFKCNLKNIYTGVSSIDEFRDEFLVSLYKRYTKDNGISDGKSKIGKEINNVFIYDIFQYPLEQVKEMYKLQHFADLKYVTGKDIGSSYAYRFTWDSVGYTFGVIQCNVSSNKNHLKFLRTIFTEEQINRITRYSIDPSSKHRYTKEEIKKHNSDINKTELDNVLKAHKTEVDNYCRNIINSRITEISKMTEIKNIVFKDETVFVFLIDYDNQFHIQNSYKGNTLLNYLKKFYKDGKASVPFGEDDLLAFKRSLDFYTNNSKSVSHENNLINKSIINNRHANLKNAVNPVFKNISFSDAKKIYENSDDIISYIKIGEGSNYSSNFYIHEVFKYFLSLIGDNGFKNIIITEPVLHTEKVEISIEDIEQESKKAAEEMINTIDNVSPSIKSPFDVIKIINVVKTVLDKLANDSDEKEEIGVKNLKYFSKEFTKLYNKTNSLTFNIDKTKLSLNAMNKELKEAKDSKAKEFEDSTYNKKELKEEFTKYSIMSELFNMMCVSYEKMAENEMAKSDFMLTGTLDSVKAFKVEDKNQNKYFDNFFIEKLIENKEEREKVKKKSPFSVLFDKNNFLYLKEADYRNLEASLRQSHGIEPDTISCRKLWILIYVIVILISKKGNTGNQSNGDFVTDISNLVNKMKSKKWRHDYSDIEKEFSSMYSFVTFSDNPFTMYMNDKGFNESQVASKELRIRVEQEKNKMIEALKEFVYKENGVYDILQGLADVAYELSTPMTLYSDFHLKEAGENIIDQFLNACVSSLEIQTSMAIYDFLFNFSIDIGGRSVSLNDLNNLIKTYNLILKVSKDNTFANQLTERKKLSRQSSDYITFQKLGFLTYNKNWNNNYKVQKELLRKVTGFYLSDEKTTYDIVEYCRNEVKCDPGDLKKLITKFQGLEDYEWLACYASHRLQNEDRGSLPLFSNQLLETFNFGHIRIKSIAESFKLEAGNKNSSTTYINPYLENLANEVIAHPEKLEEFKEKQKDIFRRFKVNMIKNESIILAEINQNISDTKMFDWLMKMLPTYQMLAETFGLFNLDSVETLDKFLSGLMDSLNLIINSTFDKWKRDTEETVKTRRIQFIEKERYYYIQSFPVLIDWVIKNLEHYLMGCGIIGVESDIDRDAFASNEERFNNIVSKFLIKLKEEVYCMSTFQLKYFEENFKNEIKRVSSISDKEAKKLLEDIMKADSAKNINIDYLSKKQIEDLAIEIEKL